MGADALPPSAQTTIVILLGADAWPSYPDFEPSQAFAHVADRFRTYFLDLQGFGLPPDNLLDLFNSPKSADEQDMQIGKFLDEHIALLKASGHGARDLLFYFVGHGGFVGNSSDFFLAT